MNSQRINALNTQDAILSETQGVLTASMSAFAETISDLPKDMQPIMMAIVAQLSTANDAINDLRTDVLTLNRTAEKVERNSEFYNLCEADRTRVMIEAQKSGHHGSLAEFYNKNCKNQTFRKLEKI